MSFIIYIIILINKKNLEIIDRIFENKELKMKQISLKVTLDLQFRFIPHGLNLNFTNL